MVKFALKLWINPCLHSFLQAEYDYSEALYSIHYKKSDDDANLPLIFGNFQISEFIKTLELDNLSPKESLDILYTLKKNYFFEK